MKRARWLALGLIVGLIAMWANPVGAVSAPSTITTCTKTSTAKVKVISAVDTAKCTKNGKGVANSWPDPAGSLSTIASYRSLAVAIRGNVAAMKADDCGLADNLTFSAQLFPERFEPLLAQYPALVTTSTALGDRCFNYVVPTVATVTVPSSLTTCTKATNGKTKVIAATAVAKCTNHGKGSAKRWYTDAALADGQASAYGQAGQFFLLAQDLLSEQCSWAQAVENIGTGDPIINEIRSDLLALLDYMGILTNCGL